MSRHNIFSFAILLFAMLLSSCEKLNLDEYLKEEGEGFRVNFRVDSYNITDFDDYSSPSASKTRARVDAKELGTVLNFAIFKDGEKLKSINQKSDAGNFGSISLSLAEGQYEVVILIHSCQGNATISSPEKITFPDNKVTETFSYYTDFEITADKDFDIAVDRCVSKFQLTIEDAVPDNIKDMKFYYTGGSSTLNATTGFGCVNSRQTEYREVLSHETGQVFEIYTFPHDIKDEINLTVTARDKGENTLHEQEFSNIPIEVNKITKHSCTFFYGGGAGNNGTNAQFVIKGNNSWNGEILY